MISVFRKGTFQSVRSRKNIKKKKITDTEEFGNTSGTTSFKRNCKYNLLKEIRNLSGDN